MPNHAHPLINRNFVLKRVGGYPSYEKCGKEQFELSIQVNSQDILSFNVRAFDILGAPANESVVYRPVESKSDPSPYEWETMIPENKDEHRNVTDYRSSPPPPVHKTPIDEKRSIPIQDLLFWDGKAGFSLFLGSILGTVDFQIEHP